jgi:hypothetical protein
MRGTLHPELGQLEALLSLDLGHNELAGELPASLGVQRRSAGAQRCGPGAPAGCR